MNSQLNVFLCYSSRKHGETRSCGWQVSRVFSRDETNLDKRRFAEINAAFSTLKVRAF